jgi:hypothetical protein
MDGWPKGVESKSWAIGFPADPIGDVGRAAKYVRNAFPAWIGTARRLGLAEEPGFTSR